MEKISNGIAKILMPISGKLAQNKFLRIMLNSFLNCLPFIVVGAFSLILSKSPVASSKMTEGTFWYDFFLAWETFCNTYLTTLASINTYTMNALSLLVCVCIGYNYAKEEGLSQIHCLLVTLATFFIVNVPAVEGGISTAYFGGSGMFTAIIATFVSLVVFNKVAKKGITIIKLPDTVPAGLKASINNMVPIFCALLTSAVLSGIFVIGMGVTFPEAFAGIANVIQFGMDNVFAGSLYYGLSSLSWWFGIHDSAILSLFSPIMFANMAANAEAVAQGIQCPYIISTGFKAFVAIGGSGGTLGLVLCCLKSKSPEIQAAGKISIVPALFGINEPIIFGLPIMLNPVFLVPFVLSAVCQTLLSYFVFSVGWVNTPAFYLGGTSPEILKQLFATSFDIRAIPLWIVLVIVQIIVWKPFLNVYEKQKLAEEAELAALQNEA